MIRILTIKSHFAAELPCYLILGLIEETESNIYIDSFLKSPNNKIEKKRTVYLENVYIKSDRLRKKDKGFKSLFFKCTSILKKIIV